MGIEVLKRKDELLFNFLLKKYRLKIHKILLFILIMSLFPLNNLKGQQIENINDSLIDIFYSTTKKAFKSNGFRLFIIKDASRFKRQLEFERL